MNLQSIAREVKAGNSVPYEDCLRLAAFYSSLVKQCMLGSTAHIPRGNFSPSYVVFHPEAVADTIEYFVDRDIFVKYDKHIIDQQRLF